jgi:membrane protease subunit HflC
VLRRADAGWRREQEIKKEVTRGREEITRTILAEDWKIIPQDVIELVDVRIKRLDHAESVREHVVLRVGSRRAHSLGA